MKMIYKNNYKVKFVLLILFIKGNKLKINKRTCLNYLADE